MVNMFHLSEHVRHGFDNLKVATLMSKTVRAPEDHPKCEDEELQALLDQDPTQTQRQLATALNVSQETVSRRLKAMGKVSKLGKWVPHDLNERQMEVTCETLLQRHERKSFLHRIVTGDEKWIYFENPKRKKLWLSPGEAAPSTPKQDRFGKKSMLYVWWDQSGIVHYELLKPGETVSAQRYCQQITNLNRALVEKRPAWAKRHGKVILLHNAPSHKAKPVRDELNSLGWEVFPHPQYSPDLAPSDYHLFASMGHALAEQHFNNYEEVGKWLDEWFAAKDKQFFWQGIHNLPKRWAKCVESDGIYFE